MPTSHYDLIVLGDDFSGLVTATLCARRGMRVLWAPSGEAPVSYTVGRFRLPVEPLALAGLASPATQRVLEELHFHHLLKRKLRNPEPAFQLVGPDARIAMTSDDSVLQRELERELLPGSPGADGALLAWCQGADRAAEHLDFVLQSDATVPPTGFWGKREVARTAERLVEDAGQWWDSTSGALSRSFLALPALMDGGCAPDAVAPVAMCRAMANWRSGVARLPGEWEALRSFFLDKFSSHNGEVRPLRPEALTTSWGKVTGIRLEEGEELGASHLVCAMPLDELLPLTDGKLAKRIAEASEPFEVGAYRYTLNLVLEGIGVPEGMGETVLAIADPGAGPEGGNALAIYVDPPDGEARVALSVQALCAAPPGGEDELDDHLANLRVRVREHLELLMPFHSDHVILAHSPHESAPAEGVGKGGALDIVADPRPLWRVSGQTMLGIDGARYQLGIKQLTVANSQILPGLGLEGDMAVGWSAAKIVCESSGKKKDFLKSESSMAR